MAENNEQFRFLLERVECIRGSHADNANRQVYIGNADEAFLLLKTAIKKKLQPVEWIRQDPDWADLCDDPRFKALVEEDEGSTS